MTASRGKARVDRHALLKRLALTIGVAALAQTACAQGVKIVPGKWEVSSTTTTPTAPQGLTNKNTDCMKDEEFDPATQLAQGGGCEVLQSSLEGNTLSWTMACKTEMGPATGRGTFKSAGTSATGQMLVNVDFNGQPIEFNTVWKGKRLGDCD